MSSALDLAERALRAADGDEAEATVQTERSGLARFAGTEVHQPTLISNETVQLRVVRDGRFGVAAGNATNDEALRALAQRAAAAADRAPVDPDFPGLAPPEEPPRVGGYDQETATLGADEQARLAGAAIDAAGDFGVYGFFTSGVSSLAVASSTAVTAEQEMTDATTLVLAAVDGASGWAEQTTWAVAESDPAAVSREAVEKARRTHGAAELEPGRWRAVLEPYAFAELLMYFSFDTFSGLALVEERSYACGRLGERVFDPKLSIADDPLDEQGLPKAFDAEGTPKRRLELVQDGALSGVVWDRSSAARAKDASSTGHALPGSLRGWGPIPLALSVAPGEAGSVDELVEAVDDGIYVTRLHYLGVVQPREGVITGMTRDGTFRIRDGKIAEPLVNLRFTVAVPDVLAEVPGLTHGRKLVNQNAFYDERYPYGVFTPALATARFCITGTGSGPGL